MKITKIECRVEFAGGHLSAYVDVKIPEKAAIERIRGIKQKAFQEWLFTNVSASWKDAGEFE